MSTGLNEEAKATMTAIEERSNSATPKIQERVNSHFKRWIERHTERGTVITATINSLRDSFEELFLGRTPEAFREAYEGWTLEEKLELYKVLFGKDYKPEAASVA